MIFLSKGGEDPYINYFAKACGSVPTPTEEFIFDESDDPIVLRGILKKKIIKRCWENKRDFFYMDTGYFGNEVTSMNPNGWKYYHRIVKNNLQHERIIERPPDRFEKIGKKIYDWKKTGKKILLACPDEKPCKFYNESYDNWINNTVEKIKSYTDRPIEIRKRVKSRLTRTREKPFIDALNDDVFALVTFNSNAAVESIFNGIPAFVLSPVHAAKPVAETNLSKIENPFYADNDLRFAWACHLSYGQFHTNELKNGYAKELMDFE